MATVTSYTKTKIDQLISDAIAATEAKVRPGQLLAQVYYNPATLLVLSPTVATFSDIDATNLSVTFIAPPTGIVDVLLEALTLGATDTSLNWNLRSGTTNLLECQVLYRINSQTRIPITFHVTGLTSGTSYTYKWGHARKVGTGAVSTFAGGPEGPAVMRVFAGKV